MDSGAEKLLAEYLPEGVVDPAMYADEVMGGGEGTEEFISVMG
jgi:hypothetical protein